MKPCTMAAAVAAATLLAHFAPPAAAHGGEDHGETATAPAAAADGAPRTSAAGDEFELVATLQGGQLLLYIDRFATNEPIANATVEVESGAFKAIATPLAPGVYATAGTAFAAAGRHPLTVTVQMDAKSGGASDLLAATLEVAAAPLAALNAPPNGAAPAVAAAWPGLGDGAVLAAATLAAFGAGVAFAALRRRGRAANGNGNGNGSSRGEAW